MKPINGKRVRELMEKKNAKTIDVDAATDFKKSHIKGAINIPHDEKDFVQKVEKKFSKKTDEVILCAQTRLEPQLTKLAGELEKAGYENVYHYSAGPSDWKTSGLNVQKQS